MRLGSTSKPMTGRAKEKSCFFSSWGIPKLSQSRRIILRDLGSSLEYGRYCSRVDSGPKPKQSSTYRKAWMSNLKIMIQRTKASAKQCVSEVSGTDSVRHVRHARCPRHVPEFRHVPFWVRCHCLELVWSQSIQTAPDRSQIHHKHILQVLTSLFCLVTVYSDLIRQQPDTPQTHYRFFQQASDHTRCW